MTKKAIIIGAGQIGRGFIGQTLFQSGYNLVFIDISEQLVECINRYGEYRVIVLGAEEKEYQITNIRAYTPSEEGCAEEFLDADIITTSVGPSVLEKTAWFIAKGIARRYEAGVEKPLTIISCENMEFATTALFKNIKPLLNIQQIEYCYKYVRFPDAEVSRLVMPVHDDNPLTVKVEQYIEWIVDSSKIKDDFKPIQGMELAKNPIAYIKRKIYTLTGHAMLGYLGYEKGYQYIYQAAYDKEIFKKVFKALYECGIGWCNEYNIPEQEFYEYVTVMLIRFSDTRLKDPCLRVCREPLRKLKQDERFIAPALLALKHHIIPYGIIDGIKTVLRYDFNGDQQSEEMQSIISRFGIKELLKRVSCLNDEDELLNLIIG